MNATWYSIPAQAASALRSASMLSVALACGTLLAQVPAGRSGDPYTSRPALSAPSVDTPLNSASLQGTLALAFQSDDFNAPTLNTSLWTYINPRSDTPVSIVGSGTGNSRLSFAVPAGVSHDVWSGNFAPRIMQPATNTDFELEVKYDSPLTAQFQMQGVIVQQNSSNYLRFDFVRDNVGTRVFAASFTSGTPLVRTDVRIASGAPLYLRVKRVGNSWTQSYSFNGTSWTAMTAFNFTLTVAQIGPFVGNQGVPASASPAFTGLVDYFFNTAAPIVPEDPPSGPVAPAITQHPADQTVTVGQTANFTVQASGTAPLTYQWQKNNVNIGGATASSYTTPATVIGDNGSTFRCLVTNSVNTATSNAATLTVNGVPPPSGIVSDDFSAPALNTSLWTYINPRSDTPVSIVGSGTSDSRLSFAVPAGVSHDVWSTGIFAPRVMQPSTNTDFELEVKFDTPMTTQYQVQGVIVQQDNTNFLRFDFVQDNAGTRVFAASFAANTPLVRTDVQIAAGTPHYLRVKRQGNSWTQSYSFNGTSWTAMTAFNFTLVVAQVGPFVGNHGIPESASPAFTGLVDYFFNTASPISPEDGATQPTIPVITSEPANQTVALGQTAGFTVQASGTAPLSYQWQKNSVNIGGATSASYTTPATVIGDNGSTFRCIVSNVAGSDTSVQALLTVQSNPGPAISVWYGSNQTFGRIGTPQRWVNIVGNASDPDGVASLSYTLNGGSSVPLTMGANQRRLSRTGDFNIDIAFSALQTGQNTVVISALDGAAHPSSANVTVTKAASPVWPMTYNVAWSTATSLQDSAQVVDGKWAVVPGGIRPLELGYDRLIGLGDTLWADYEVTALITVNAIDSTAAAYDAVNAGPGLGFLLRWGGHTDNPDSGPLYAQPKNGYLPLGALGWFTWRNGFNSGLQNRWEILGNNLNVKDQNTAVPLPYGVAHYFKMRVSTVPGQGGLYSFKAWPASQAEPSTWMMSGQETLSDPQRGGLLLVAHHVDATIGTVTIRPVDVTAPLLSNINAAPGTTTASISWATNEPATSKVRYGLTNAYTDSVVNSALVLPHLLGLTGLTPSTPYHYSVVSVDASGNSVSSGDLLFTTSGSAALAFQSDDFSAPALNTSLWTYINPRSDTPVSIVGSGTSDSRLSFAVPAGVSHDVWSTGIFAPRVMQPSTNTDFELEVKFDTPMTTQYQVQGVIVQQDNTNFLRFDFVQDNAGTRVFAASFAANTPLVRTDVQIAAGTPHYLRVKRQGNSWTQSYSFNGTSWTAMTAFNFTLVVAQVGPFVGNHGIPESASPAFTGLVDYFFNTASPISPEDGATQPTIPVITSEPANQTVALGQTAGFTVQAGGTAPLSYQWQKNSVNIGGATSPSYTTPATVQGDSGAHFRCLVSNSAGADTSVQALLSVTSGSGNPSGIVSDLFNAGTLNSTLWTFVNPRGDGVVSMTGTQVSLSLPAGVSHDVWSGGNLAPRIMQASANADFEIELKFDAPVTQMYQMQGVIVQEDLSRFLRFDLYHDGSSAHVFAASFTGGVPTFQGDVALAGVSPAYFRIKRQTNQWTVSTSPDNSLYTQAITFSQTLTVSSVGAFAANHGIPENTTPAWTSLIDYFINTAAPIPPAKIFAEGAVQRPPLIPGGFVLEGNYPNPFNPSTTIRYGLPEPATVSLRVYSMLGQEVVELVAKGEQEGYHGVVWDGRNANGVQVGSGVFLCRMVATGVSGKTYVVSHRMMLIK